MPTKLHSDFIGDLVQIGDAAFAGRALRKCFDDRGRFIDRAKEDHRYHGIDDAWIRKISRGMRIIYIRNGEEVTLYRAGQHSVEDNLPAPAHLDGIFVGESDMEHALNAGPGQAVRRFAGRSTAGGRSEVEVEHGLGRGRLLYNHAERFLYGNLLGRRFLPHKDVYLVSPYLSPSLLRSTHPFGQMLDELIEGGATVWLVTKPPLSADDLAPYNDLEARGLNVFFNSSLHAKIYAFILNRPLLKPAQSGANDFVALGSANLTFSGVNPSGLLKKDFQYELSYETHDRDWDGIERFILHVTELGTELRVVRANLAGQQRLRK